MEFAPSPFTPKRAGATVDAATPPANQEQRRANGEPTLGEGVPAPVALKPRSAAKSAAKSVAKMPAPATPAAAAARLAEEQAGMVTRSVKRASAAAPAREDVAVDDDRAAALQKLVIPELKELLRARKLPVSGNKPVLIQRLLDDGWTVAGAAPPATKPVAAPKPAAATAPSPLRALLPPAAPVRHVMPPAFAALLASGADAAAEDEDEEEWLEHGHDFVGRRVLRFFSQGPVAGRIVAWMPETEEFECIFRVLHDDGDEEDLDMREAAAAIEATGTCGA